MSDADERQLARTAMATLATSDVDRLKAAWARTLEWRECEERRENGSVCGTHVPVLVWERHRERHVSARALAAALTEAVGRTFDDERPTLPPAPRATPVRSAAEPRRRGMTVVPIPTGAIAMRPRKSPLWHRLIVQPGQDCVRFFHDHGGQITFFYGDHRGSIPRNAHYWAYGVSLMIDADAHTADSLGVYTSGVVQFAIGPQVLADWPAKLAGSDSSRLRTFLADEVMLDPTSGIELDMLSPARSLVVSGRPVELASLEAWSLNLLLPKPVTRPTGITGVVFGVGALGTS